MNCYFFSGYQGTMCEIPDPRSACVHSQCQNGATCRLQGSLEDYVCECAAGFRGKKKKELGENSEDKTHSLKVQTFTAK